MGARTVPTAVHPLVRSVAGWERGWWLLKQYWPTRLARIMGVPKGWDAASRDPNFLAIRTTLPCRTEEVGGRVRRRRVRAGLQLVPTRRHPGAYPSRSPADDRLALYECAASRGTDTRARLRHDRSGGHLFLEHAPDVRQATTAFVRDLLRQDGQDQEGE